MEQYKYYKEQLVEQIHQNEILQNQYSQLQQNRKILSDQKYQQVVEHILQKQEINDKKNKVIYSNFMNQAMQQKKIKIVSKQEYIDFLHNLWQKNMDDNYTEIQISQRKVIWWQNKVLKIKTLELLDQFQNSLNLHQITQQQQYNINYNKNSNNDLQIYLNDFYVWQDYQRSKWLKNNQNSKENQIQQQQQKSHKNYFKQKNPKINKLILSIVHEENNDDSQLITQDNQQISIDFTSILLSKSNSPQFNQQISEPKNNQNDQEFDPIPLQQIKQESQKFKKFSGTFDLEQQESSIQIPKCFNQNMRSH